MSHNNKNLLTLVITLFLISISFAFSAQSQIKDIKYPLGAASCRIDATVCRTPDYSYNGILRTGYLKVQNKTGSALGFMFFGKLGAPIQDLQKIPTVISLGGGPGSSSQFSNFKQIGPFILKKTFSPVIIDNKYTWARDFNLLFIDQPLGTGVSCLNNKNDIPTNMTAIVDDFWRAFNNIFSTDGCFNEKKLNITPASPFFIFGEGYGGKFSSAIGARIINEKNAGKFSINLKGVAIGDGLNSPFKIMSQIGTYGFSMSFLDYQQRMRMEKILLKSSINQNNKQWTKLKTDFEQAISYLYKRTGVNYYDISKDSFDEDLLQAFLGNTSNLKAFSFQPSNTFYSFSQQVYDKLSGDFMKNQVASVEYLLKNQIPVLVYHGQDDAYVNPIGAMKWTEDLNHPYTTQYRNLNLKPWIVNDIMFGSYKTSGKLTFMMIHNSGHYVPQDQPEAAYYMAKNWITANNVKQNKP